MNRLLTGLLLASALQGAESLDLAFPGLIADGTALFAKNCSVGYCHGAEGRSARGPALRDRYWDPLELHRITADGLPGTSMPGWKSVLSEIEVWAVTAYVLSLSSEPPRGHSALVELEGSQSSAESVPLSAEASLGKGLFFDLTRERRCSVCHQLGGMGTVIGPNLALVARAKTTEELQRAILDPQAEIAYGFEQIQVELRSGERIEGVLFEETESKIRIFDSASIPPPLRSVRKRDIRAQGTRERSSMPSDLNEVYSMEEISSIVTYLVEVSR